MKSYQRDLLDRGKKCECSMENIFVHSFSSNELFRAGY